MQHKNIWEPKLFTQGHLNYQRALPYQPIPNTQDSWHSNPLVMVSILWVAPITLLLAVGLINSLRQKYKFRREVDHLTQVATLERTLRLKPNKKH